MAFDLLSGKLGGRDWSRGDWATSQTVSVAAKKIPWTTVGIAAGVAGIFLLLPSLKPRKTSAYYKRSESRTRQIPSEPMSDVVHYRRT